MPDKDGSSASPCSCWYWAVRGRELEHWLATTCTTTSVSALLMPDGGGRPSPLLTLLTAMLRGDQCCLVLPCMALLSIVTGWWGNGKSYPCLFTLTLPHYLSTSCFCQVRTQISFSPCPPTLSTGGLIHSAVIHYCRVSGVWWKISNSLKLCRGIVFPLVFG